MASTPRKRITHAIDPATLQSPSGSAPECLALRQSALPYSEAAIVALLHAAESASRPRDAASLALQLIVHATHAGLLLSPPLRPACAQALKGALHAGRRAVRMAALVAQHELVHAAGQQEAWSQAVAAASTPRERAAAVSSQVAASEAADVRLACLCDFARNCVAEVRSLTACVVASAVDGQLPLAESALDAALSSGGASPSSSSRAAVADAATAAVWWHALCGDYCRYSAEVSLPPALAAITMPPTPRRHHQHQPLQPHHRPWSIGADGAPGIRVPSLFMSPMRSKQLDADVACEGAAEEGGISAFPSAPLNEVPHDVVEGRLPTSSFTLPPLPRAPSHHACVDTPASAFIDHAVSHYSKARALGATHLHPASPLLLSTTLNLAACLRDVCRSEVGTSSCSHPPSGDSFTREHVELGRETLQGAKAALAADSDAARESEREKRGGGTPVKGVAPSSPPSSPLWRALVFRGGEGERGRGGGGGASAQAPSVRHAPLSPEELAESSAIMDLLAASVASWEAE